MQKKKPLYSEIVVKYIRDAVRKETILPGQKLYEQTLAGELRISRAPIREALNRLSGEGLLVSHPRHGKCVNILTAQQIEDAYILGGAVCGVSVARCIASYTDADVGELERITEAIGNVALHGGQVDSLERLGQAFNARLMFYPNMRWHRTPVDFCALLSCVLYYKTRRRVITPREDYSARRHILKPLRSRNAAGLEKVLRDLHYELGKRMYGAGCDLPHNLSRRSTGKWFSPDCLSPRQFYPIY